MMRGLRSALQAIQRMSRELFDHMALPSRGALGASVDSVPVESSSGVTEQQISQVHEALGRELLKELPHRLGAIASAALTGRVVPDFSDWQVYRELNKAVRAATEVLSPLIEVPLDATCSDDDSEPATLMLVGTLARRYVEATVSDPETLVRAARYVMQIDRSRKAALYLRMAEGSIATPGPLGGAGSSHVLYLRSFVASSHLPRGSVEPWGVLDLEEVLACAFDESPLIALGNPELERFGPGRSTTVDENWRAVLRSLALEAQMIVVIPAQTQGTSWEIEWVVLNKFLHKTCFVMPPASATDEAWWTDNWRQLKQWTVRFGFDVPDYAAEGCVFRLSAEGQVDRCEFSVVYEPGNLKMTLMHQLLFRPGNIGEFLFALQQSLSVEPTSSNTIDSPQLSQEERDSLAALEAAERLDMANWFYDSPRIPATPGVVVYFETPARMVWAEETDNLNATLGRHSEGAASDFARALFNLTLLEHLTPQQVDQLSKDALTLESIVSFRVKEIVSYRFATVPNLEQRGRLLALIRSGASNYGVPHFERTGEAGNP